MYYEKVATASGISTTLAGLRRGCRRQGAAIDVTARGHRSADGAGAGLERGTMNRRWVKDSVRTAAKSLFATADLFASRAPGPRILIYHQIEAGLGRQMEVTEAAFKEQLEWIQQHGQVVDLDTAIDMNPGVDSSDTFVLTFDDGYRDMHERAWPLLRQRDLPFLLYLTTDPVESQRSLTPGGRAEPLTWAQIDEMLASGLMTLGAHTHRHRDLRTLASDEIEAEVDQSNQLIERRMGMRPRHFAYPWGYWSETADAVIRRVYATAALGSGRPITPETDPLLLNRVPVQLSDTIFFFKRKMATGMRFEDRTRRAITGYHGP